MIWSQITYSLGVSCFHSLLCTVNTCNLTKIRVLQQYQSTADCKTQPQPHTYSNKYVVTHNVFTNTWNFGKSTNIQIIITLADTHIYTHTHTHASTHTQTHTHTRARARTQARTHTHTHTQSHTHSHTL